MAAAGETEAKPAVAPANDDTVSIRVSAQDGSEVHFKIKKGTSMSKLMTAYCERQGVDRSAVRFLYDGQRVTDSDTAKSLDMDDQDVIDAVLEQTGGGGYW